LVYGRGQPSPPDPHHLLEGRVFREGAQYHWRLVVSALETSV